MRLGRVTGNVVATHKNEKLTGAKLLIVQPLAAAGTPEGPALLAVDSAQAGVGDTVLLVIEGRAAGEALRRRAAPVDVAIVGVVDTVDTGSNQPPNP